MKIDDGCNSHAILKELGQRVKDLRIDSRLSQEECAAIAGISRRTLSLFESGQDIHLSKFIWILRTLKVLDNLNLLIPEKPQDPRDWSDLGHNRKRVLRTRNDEKSGDWKWGDEL